MWIKKLGRRKADSSVQMPRETGITPVRKNPARPVLWAALAVAALMLTTFVVFGATGSGIIRTAPLPGYTEGSATP